MDERRISPGTTVAEALRTAGRVQQVFIRRRTACVGCSLARFCSLQDVAATYELDLEALLRELEQAADTRTQLAQRSDL